MKDIGVLYICTGKYFIFWKEFYKSCERHFLPGVRKQYFVFTDAESIYAQDFPFVHKIFRKKNDFPLDTLLRYEMFDSIKEQLSMLSYLYYFNANIKILKDISGDEVFPGDNENGLIGYLHSGFYDKKPVDFIYERNPVSKAYIKMGDGRYYYQGCLIGGRSVEFLQMITELKEKVQEDLNKNIIAIWWDESHLNHYLKDKKVKLLHPGYAYPEMMQLPFEKKAVMFDKSRRAGLSFLRGTKKITIMDKLKFYIKRTMIR